MLKAHKNMIKKNIAKKDLATGILFCVMTEPFQRAFYEIYYQMYCGIY